MALLAAISIGRLIVIPAYQVFIPPFSSRSPLPSDHPTTMTRPLLLPSHAFDWLTRCVCGPIRHHPSKMELHPPHTLSVRRWISSNRMAPAGHDFARRQIATSIYWVCWLPFRSLSLLPSRDDDFLHVTIHTILIYQVSIPPFSPRPPFPPTTMTRPLPPPSHTFGRLTRRVCGPIRHHPSKMELTGGEGLWKQVFTCWEHFRLCHKVLPMF